MFNTILTALNKAESFVATSIQKIKGLSKPVGKFFTWLFDQWWMLPVRHNFLNLSRYGGYSEKAIHQQFKRKLPFVPFFHALFAPLQKKECIAAFDPSFIAKSGKKTYGLGKFWNGSRNRTMKGLEIGCLALIDVADRTAYCIEAEQTPSKAKNLIKHYSGIIKRHINDIVPYTQYLAADGYFWKKSIVGDLLKLGLHVISKGRHDCKLFYLHQQEPQQSKRGRSRKYDGRVDWEHIDLKRWALCYEDEEICAWELVAWSPMLEQEVKAVYVKEKNKKKGAKYAVVLCTNKDLAGQKVLWYYHLRFQIEFLIRDAKSYMGLEHCQSRQKVKLYNHFNMSLYSVSVAKFLLWAQQPGKKKPPFSMRSIKTYFTNKFFVHRIFSSLDLDLNDKKIQKLWQQCLNIGAMVA